MNPETLRDKICSLLDAKKAADIRILDVAHLTTVADYFIVAGGTSTTNVRALAEYVEAKLEDDGIFPLRKEGIKDARWAVYDYGSVVAHILLDDMRLFYCLEKLWSDGKNITRYTPPKAAEDAKPAKKRTGKTGAGEAADTKSAPVKRAGAKSAPAKKADTKSAPAKKAVKPRASVKAETAVRVKPEKPDQEPAVPPKKRGRPPKKAGGA